MLSQCIIDFSKDPNATHIIVKYVSTVKAPHNQFIYDTIMENLIDITTHKHGCCILQKCLEHANPKQRKMIIDKLLENTILLMCDAFGNYVLQYIVTLNDYETNYKIGSYFKSHIAYMSKQKFSSNVIEKVNFTYKLIFSVLIIAMKKQKRC
jgi:pumilio RNA-binding family